MRTEPPRGALKGTHPFRSYAFRPIGNASCFRHIAKKHHGTSWIKLIPELRVTRADVRSRGDLGSEDALGLGWSVERLGLPGYLIRRALYAL